MRRIGVVVDSTMNLPDEFIKKLGVQVVRPNIIVDGVSYTDGVDITTDEVIQFAEEGKKVTSSQPSPEAFLDAFKEVFKQGFEDVIVLTVSSGVSGTHQSAVIAADLITGMNIEVVDSRSSAMGGEIIIAETLDLIMNGGTLEEAKNKMLEIRERLEVRITVDDLTALFRGGRMTRTQSMIGSLLKIKPVIKVNKEGKLELSDKVRTRKKLLDFIVDTVVSSKPLSEKLHVRISPIGVNEAADEIKRMILERVEDARVFICKEITPVLSVHFGRGGLGVAWLT